MGLALYRKYRSKSLDEVVGQEHITTTLKNALKSGNISHAYLFTGPRGVGKTSIARILAYEVNGFTYTDENTPIDIIEIDAASNRRIDEIRELRDKVHIAPTSAKYKVYIIDEVHMLTKEAFNALLKTLEEPPAHVIFILATTEAHKLPDTIVSRTQRFSFKPINKQQATDHLRKIAASEGIKIDERALELLAEHGEGSFRDSISLLDQASSISNKITEKEVLDLLGIAPRQAIEQLARQLYDTTPRDLLNSLSDFNDQGYQPVQIAKQLAAVIRDQVSKQEVGAEAITLLRQLITISSSPEPNQALELVLLEFVLEHTLETSNSVNKAVTEKTREKTQDYIPQHHRESVNMPKKTPHRSDRPFNMDLWPEVLIQVKQRFNTLYGILRVAEPSINGHELTLTFQFPFHQKRLSEPKNKQIISDIIKQLSGQAVAIVCVSANKQINPQDTVAQALDKKAIDTISDIFGGVEVLD